MGNKIAILGLDGLDRYFVEDRLEDLGAFRELMEEDRTGFLESTLPPITAPAWACSFTGKRPERLDRFDFQVLDFDTYEFDPVSDSEYWYQEFWHFMDGRAAIADVPGFEIRDIDGWAVQGLFDMTEETTYPPELAGEMSEDLDDFLIEGLESFSSEEDRRDAAFEFFEKRRKVLDWLIDNKDADVYFQVFRLPDTMMHHCDNDDQMLEAYRRCDEYVGELMDRDDVNLIVLSDHGAVKATRRFSVNTWLKENGYLEQREGEERSALKDLAFEVAEFAERFGLRDYVVRANELWKSFTGENFVERNLELDSVDWENTQAFSYMTGVCAYSGIWINDQRFAEPGTDDREEVKQSIRDEMSDHPLVEEVLTKEEAFEEQPEKFPDLVAVLKDKVKNDSDIKPDVTGKISSYMHRKQGFIGVHGPDLEMNEDDAELIDLAPTVLHYFGEEIPDDMDGKVMDIFAGGSGPAEREPERESSEVADLDI
ncbi:MAG: alkaline phosphatase family protein [Candidatus Nanohaloarchaea archaeon]